MPKNISLYEPTQTALTAQEVRDMVKTRRAWIVEGSVGITDIDGTPVPSVSIERSGKLKISSEEISVPLMESTSSEAATIIGTASLNPEPITSTIFPNLNTNLSVPLTLDEGNHIVGGGIIHPETRLLKPSISPQLAPEETGEKNDEKVKEAVINIASGETLTITSNPSVETSRPVVEPITQERYNNLLNVNSEFLNKKTNRLTKQENKGVKRLAYIEEPKGVAKISLIEDGTNNVKHEMGLFILTSFEEGMNIRHQVVGTQDVDIINFFEEEAKIWAYSGVTLNGARGSVQIKDGNTLASNNWYKDFNAFAEDSLGAPSKVGKNKKKVRHKVRMEYMNFVREGFLLNVRYSSNASNPKLVNIYFQIAISDQYTI